MRLFSKKLIIKISAKEDKCQIGMCCIMNRRYANFETAPNTP